MLRRQLVAAFVTALLVLACSPPEDRAERARETIQQALQRGDRASALDALEDLRESQPDTPEGVIELSSLLISAGEARAVPSRRLRPTRSTTQVRWY